MQYNSQFLQEIHEFGIFGRNSYRMRKFLFIGFILLVGYSYTQTGTLTDSRDGKVYKTVVIGTQTWMAENLNVATFRNGDLIPEAKTIKEWILAGENNQPVWCYYKNKKKNGIKYGKLYNWYAVIDKRGLAPEGLHIPMDTEWTKLTDFLGGASISGAKMKNENDWNDNKVQFVKGDNFSGFLGLPGGLRSLNGSFGAVGINGDWWSATEYDTNNAYYRFLVRYDISLYRDNYNKARGMSVRCIKD